MLPPKEIRYPCRRVEIYFGVQADPRRLDARMRIMTIFDHQNNYILGAANAHSSVRLRFFSPKHAFTFADSSQRGATNIGFWGHDADFFVVKYEFLGFGIFVT